MHRSELINHLIWKVGYNKAYLEIGLDNPENNYFKIQCANKESVDPYLNLEIDQNFDIEYAKEKVLTYKMTSDDFFIQNTKKYDVIFIDGLHKGVQVVKDIQNSLNYLNPGGYVIVHDCLPINEESQTEERGTAVHWNGSVWKAIPNLSMIDGISFRVVDTDEGCAIIQKYKNNLDFSKYKVSDLQYNEVFNNIKIRNSILHVISQDEFFEIYR